MPVIGFLHTAEIHVPAFRALLAELAPDARDLHLVDATLLANARDGLPYQERLTARLAELAGGGAEVVVCTCSTIAGAAERLVPGVLRIDRPMIEQAVAHRRIGLVHALESALAPARELLAELGAGCEVVELPCPAAWALFEAGDLAGYRAAVAAEVRAAAAGLDVAVLAQASMAPAAVLLADLPLPVLASPRPAVAAALAAAQLRAAGPATSASPSSVRA
ncbi:arylsulfatase [Kitasatospora sp. NPDC006697]|uniref:arylsulfatase n=1 Tax=Kitasatospora sp. NPDC006697 TaxID=3364020 RepID=UPI0036B5D383